MKERERKRLKKSGEILLSIHDLLGSEKRHQRGKGRERKKKCRIVKKFPAQSSDDV